jgi:hypothetical protein
MPRVIVPSQSVLSSSPQNTRPRRAAASHRSFFRGLARRKKILFSFHCSTLNKNFKRKLTLFLAERSIWLI